MPTDTRLEYRVDEFVAKATLDFDDLGEDFSSFVDIEFRKNLSNGVLPVKLIVNHKVRGSDGVLLRENEIKLNLTLEKARLFVAWMQTVLEQTH